MVVFFCTNISFYMADNYLEKRYEQYEKRKKEWELKNRHGLSKFLKKKNETKE